MNAVDLGQSPGERHDHDWDEHGACRKCSAIDFSQADNWRPPAAEDVFADRVRQATATAADRVIDQAAPAPATDFAGFKQLIHDTLQAGFAAAGTVLDDYLLFGNTPVEDRPAMLARSGWPAPKTWSDEDQPFTRDRAEDTVRRLTVRDPTRQDGPLPEHRRPPTFTQPGNRGPLSGRHAPFDVDGRIPFGRLTTRQRGQLNQWLWDLGIKADRVDAGSIIEQDGAEWRIGLRRPGGGYIVVRRLDPRLLIATRPQKGRAITNDLVNAEPGPPLTRAHLQAAITMLARSGWPAPKTWSDEDQPFTRERAEETARRLTAQQESPLADEPTRRTP